MSQSTYSVRMEENLKTQFEELCDSFGMNMNTAFNVFARAVVRERRIPFEISAKSDPFYSEANQAYLLKSVQELREGKGKVHELIEAEDE